MFVDFDHVARSFAQMKKLTPFLELEAAISVATHSLSEHGHEFKGAADWHEKYQPVCMRSRESTHQVCDGWRTPQDGWRDDL